MILSLHFACAQDSDRYWRLPPPARAALEALLAQPDQAPALALSWAVERDAPLEGKHGGPLCRGTREVPLSGRSRDAVLAVLQVRHTPCTCSGGRQPCARCAGALRALPYPQCASA